MTWFKKVLAAALVGLLMIAAFGYGACVGYYRWPPFGLLVAIAQTVRERAPGPR